MGADHQGRAERTGPRFDDPATAGGAQFIAQRGSCALRSDAELSQSGGAQLNQSISGLAPQGQGPTIPENHVVRRKDRRQLIHPRRQWRDYLLTPNLTGKLQVILSVIEPGGGSGDEAYAHDSDEECVVILRGRLEFWVGSDWYLLEEGDSIVFESRIPHRNSNPGPDQAEVLWITTPPSY